MKSSNKENLSFNVLVIHSSHHQQDVETPAVLVSHFGESPALILIIYISSISIKYIIILFKDVSHNAVYLSFYLSNANLWQHQAHWDRNVFLNISNILLISINHIRYSIQRYVSPYCIFYLIFIIFHVQFLGSTMGKGMHVPYITLYYIISLNDIRYSFQIYASPYCINYTL